MSDKTFWWSDEAVTMLRERYVIDGPTKLAAILGTSRMSVTCKARRLKIAPSYRPALPHDWTENEDAMMVRLYPTSDKPTLEREFGLPYYVLQRRARRLGLFNANASFFSARTRSQQCRSCDIHFFDEWSPDMAYILGFLFADGSISKRQYDVIIGIADKDEVVLRFIKDKTKCKTDISYRDKHVDSRGHVHARSCWLYVRSTLMVKRLMEMGLKPRKTYNDDPFPEVPDAMMKHFIRGYFDGDGTACITGQGYCHIGMIGSPKFIVGLRDSLVRLVGMSCVNTVLQNTKTPCIRITWGGKDDLKRFRDYIYADRNVFCLARKRDKLEQWLVANEHRSERQPHWRYFSEEEIDQIRKFYALVGPIKLAELLGRSVMVIRQKAKQLGLPLFSKGRPKP